ncbi:ABC transporter substrate-binding protein [Frankia sp. Cas4]|uniref:ABC transporter substrate-binding protein n=1 Tax=Frankia sp. Cas4 TaxID=3073927 RepID=UPI002AD57ADC|nr:ABC transporter substrate-binding protein [Frankia sp. Cas4]
MIAAFVLTATAVACGGSSGTSTTAAASATGTPDLSGVTLRVGETGYQRQRLYLEAAGLANTPYKVEYATFDSGTLQLQAIAAGNLDLAQSSEIPPIFASQSAGGGNFRVVAVMQATTLLQEVLIPKGSSLKSIADLKGKKVGYVASTTAHYFLFKLLEQAGLGWNDIQPVKLTVPDGVTALLSGNVDALATYGNAVITAKQRGATTLGSGEKILSGNYAYEATPKAIADQAVHAAIADFLGRQQKAYAWSRAHPDDWAKITAEQTKQPVAQALETFNNGEAQRPTRLVPTSPATTASAQDVADVFIKAELLKSKVNVADYFSTAFNAEIEKFGT